MVAATASVPDSECRHTLLVNGPVARVERCERCGVVTMHLGVVSLRLDADALGSLWVTLGDAVTALEKSPRLDLGKVGRSVRSGVA